MVEETTAESQNLAHEAATLSSLVSHFKVGASGKIRESGQSAAVTAPIKVIQGRVQKVFGNTAVAEDSWTEF